MCGCGFVGFEGVVIVSVEGWRSALRGGSKGEELKGFGLPRLFSSYVAAFARYSKFT